MVFCAAVGCCSRSGKSQDTSFYRLSKMVTKIEERQFAIKKKIRVCHLQFENECFKQDLEVFNHLLWKIFKSCLLFLICYIL